MSQTSINRVTIVGHLTGDPEQRDLRSGGNVCHLRIACNSRRRNLQDEWESKPNFFSVSVFGPQGDTVRQFLKKGSAVAIDGRLEWREWETADQQKRESVVIIASNVQFLGGGSEAPRSAEVGRDELTLDEMEMVAEASVSDYDFEDIRESVGLPRSAEKDSERMGELVGVSTGGATDGLLF